MSLPIYPPAGVRQPIWGSPVQKTAKVLENEFGDGYTQRAADGINNVKETWDITYKNLTTAEKLLHEAFFDSLKGYLAFRWMAFGATTYKAYTCKNYGFTPTTAGYWDGKASFRQEFESVA